MPYVTSTITSSMTYCEYEGSDTTKNRPIKRQITIKGGHGVAQERTLHTPRGVATHVTDDELAFLEKSESFRRHVKAGYITVHKSQTDPKKVAANMKDKDDSAPKVESDFSNSEAKPVVEKAEKPSKPSKASKKSVVQE